MEKKMGDFTIRELYGLCKNSEGCDFCPLNEASLDICNIVGVIDQSDESNLEELINLEVKKNG